ncbi:MAG TPA: M50 family metallopeptidase [Solirubrobacteraceae bacterium]
MSYLLAFAGFAALVVLHEAGHFAAAKAVGMRVEKFSLFFGPMLVKWRWGETVYGIGPIPLGGYVKITGQNPHEPMAPEVAPRAFFRQPVWKRVVVIAAGPAVNLVLAFLLVWGVYTFNGGAKPSRTIAAVNPHAPAAGLLHKGDRLVAVDGRRASILGMSKLIARHHCAIPPIAGCTAATPARITVARRGQVRTFAIAPRYDPDRRRTLVGFAYGSVTVSESPDTAAHDALTAMWKVTSGTVSAIANALFSSQDRKKVGSVVGAYEVTRQSFTFSTAAAMFLLGMISLSLAIVNLFPFLPLDGGHIFWALAEKVRGRPIPFSVMERAGAIGFVLILMLFFVGVTNDIDRLTGRGFGIR